MTENPYINARIHRRTVSKLRDLSDLSKETREDIIDRLVEQELEKLHRSNAKSAEPVVAKPKRRVVAEQDEDGLTFTSNTVQWSPEVAAERLQQHRVAQQRILDKLAVDRAHFGGRP